MAGETSDAGEGGTRPSGGVSGTAGSAQPTGGRPVNPDGGAPEGGTSGDGGAAAAGSDFGAGGCGDLDHNDVQDCDETVVDNARFDQSVEGWKAELTVSQQWDERNARADQDSGTISVTNATVAEVDAVILGGSGQCQPALGSQDYLVAARTFMAGGQGEGSAGVNVWFYGADDCADYLLSSLGPASVTQTDSWVLVQGAMKSPPATRSMRVRLVVQKPYTQTSLTALFDDVLVREQ